ncbi:uncharacterized protein DUF742 [Labedaea rhizosphaerae]|uniref:Uncharacterized protein DUF742 n=2 Tax=Labedaea rhizosphaerae TaxID=598644 RepID=A0A4R6SEE4_LABRH|nr:uncharacterized protein DUF742 [Labedaea rhizosphaerae]
MDLFGMYGSRDDAEHEQETTEDQPTAAKELSQAPEAVPVEEDTIPLDLRGLGASDRPLPVAGHENPSQFERATRSASDEQVQRYVDELGLVDARRRLVRPYATTGGRTYSGTDLGLETMIAVTRRGGGAVKPEHRQVAGLCGQPASVAEIAAHTQLPIGAARVVIADMIKLDLVLICSTQSAEDAPSADLMSRVLEGLRRL